MSRPLRAVVAVTEDPGHAFPALALARELQGRGHAVVVDTSTRWRDAVDDFGAGFVAAPEYPAHHEWGRDGIRPGVVDAARARIAMLDEIGPDVVVSDVFTPAPALAAEAAGVRCRTTLISLVYTMSSPGLPVYSLGLLPPRTALGASAWRLAGAPLERLLPHAGWSRKLLAGLNLDRAALGLSPLARLDGGVTEGPTLVATLPQLEYPRRWPAEVHVTGPMFFDWPRTEVELPPGEDPLVFVTSSTVSDPELRLTRMTLAALAGEPVRVVATISRRGRRWTGPLPDNATVLDWLPYSQLMSRASAVVSQGGHGAVTQALAEGAPVLVCPADGDMAENGARVAWTGAGLMVPRALLGPRPVRWATRRLLTDARFAMRAREIAVWGRDNDGAARAADLVERYAGA